MGKDAVLAANEAVQSSTTGSLSKFFGTYGTHIMTVVFIIAVILVTWFLKRFAVFVLRRIEKQLRESDNASAAAVIGFTVHLVAGLIYLAGGIVIISSIPGLESALKNLLAAGGVLAVIAGLASQQALGNMVSGLMILAFKPFKLGDSVRYVDSDISGVVEEITVHHTTLRTFENKRVIIPNSKMNSAIIENADYADSKVCIFFEVMITYESDIALAKKIIVKEIQTHPDFYDNRSEEEMAAGEPPVLVRVVSLAGSGVTLRAWLWAKDNGIASVMKSDLMQHIKTSLTSAGVALAYPHIVVVNQ